MKNDRHQRVASLLREMAAQYIRQETNTHPLITVTRAQVSSDYRAATIFFTTIPEDREADALIFLKRSAGDLRRLVKAKSNLKIIPHFEFTLDADERHRQYTDDDNQETQPTQTQNKSSLI